MHIQTDRQTSQREAREETRGRRRHQQSDTMSTAAIAARRALQQQRARVLYRRALRNVLSYAVHRDIFYVEVLVSLSLSFPIIPSPLPFQPFLFSPFRCAPLVCKLADDTFRFFRVLVAATV
jgi:hypothetical protein